MIFFFWTASLSGHQTLCLPICIYIQTCVLPFSADGYEEHSMDATDSQHYKEVTLFFFLVLSLCFLVKSIK